MWLSPGASDLLSRTLRVQVCLCLTVLLHVKELHATLIAQNAPLFTLKGESEGQSLLSVSSPFTVRKAPPLMERLSFRPSCDNSSLMLSFSVTAPRWRPGRHNPGPVLAGDEEINHVRCLFFPLYPVHRLCFNNCLFVTSRENRLPPISLPCFSTPSGHWSGG